MRNFYFAQVIYFTTASYLELVVALLYLGVSTTLSLLLVPRYGPAGAATALMVACIVACLAFMVLGRRWYRMPVDLTALAVMPALAGVVHIRRTCRGQMGRRAHAAAPDRRGDLCGLRRLCRAPLRSLEPGDVRCRRRKRDGAVDDERAQRHFGVRSSSAAGSRAMPNFSACRFRCSTRWK